MVLILQCGGVFLVVGKVDVEVPRNCNHGFTIEKKFQTTIQTVHKHLYIFIPLLWRSIGLYSHYYVLQGNLQGPSRVTLLAANSQIPPLQKSWISIGWVLSNESLEMIQTATNGENRTTET